MAASAIRTALRAPRGSRRYGVVLVLIITSLILQMAVPDKAWARLISGLLQLGILLIAFRVSDVHRRHWPFVWALVASATIALIVAKTSSGDTGLGLSAATSCMMVALTLGTIAIGVVASLREQRRVTFQNVLGVICVYLLIGSVFSYIYGTIAAFGDANFFAQGTDGTHQDQLYFSFITETTVGYGDFTAAGGLGRSLAAFEALLGQLYLVTIVALMVSNLRPGAARSGEPEA